MNVNKITLGILSLQLGLLITFPSLSQNLTAPPKSKGKYTLFASGDINLARWVPHSVAEEGPKWPLTEILDLSKNADMALTNLECVLATEGDFNHKGERRPYLYRGRPEMIDVLAHAGFDVVTVANNHGMDYGGVALLEQIDILNASGIAATGGGKNYSEASKPVYVQTGDVIIAFIGMEHHFPKYAATKDKAGIFHAMGMKNITNALKPIINEATKNADLVVFSPHWGANWKENVKSQRVELARWIIDQGVDAILGHSSHHIHGIEIYKGRPIVYDMGTYLFDRVMQHRMRYSAGFTLEFDKNGFTKLTITPVRLKTNRTIAPSEEDIIKIHNLIRNLSKELDDEIEFKQENDNLVIEFEPESKPFPKTEHPEQIFQSGNTRLVPEKYRNKKTNVVVDSPPAWTTKFTPVTLQNGVRILGATNAEAVWPGSAFVAEVLLEVPGKLDGSWVGIIKGENRNGDGRIFWLHPIADAGWTTNLWEKGQLVNNRTLVRPSKIPEGTYDLYFSMSPYNPLRRRAGTPVDIVNPPKGSDPKFAKIGHIKVTTDNIPKGPSGVSWQGLLPTNKKFNKKAFEKALKEQNSPFPPNLGQWIAAALGIAVLMGLGIAIIIIKRKQSKDTETAPPKKEQFQEHSESSNEK